MMNRYRVTVSLLVLMVLASTLPLGRAATNQALKLDPSILGMPSEPWPLVRQGLHGPETYLIPTQQAKISQLPEPERSQTLHFIRDHDANLSTLKATLGDFVSHVQSGAFSRVPEYTRDLNVVVMGVEPYDARNENPIYMHEPVLQALPSYTHVVMLVPESAEPRVKSRLKALGLADRVQIVINRKVSDTTPVEGVTHWIRDTMFVVRDDSGVTILTSLAHKDFEEVFRNDLGYLNRIGGHGRHVLRMPIFFRGGNVLAVAHAGRRLLLVGSDELEMNRKWFDGAFGFTPPPNAIPDILKAAAGVDEVVVLPNSRTLFHLDTFVAPLGDGLVGLLEPLDPGRMAAADREVLIRTRASLKDLGFKVVAIPTTVQRMEKFQSPANVVAFTDTHTGHRRALVPLFPEPKGDSSAQGLNKEVLSAYRDAGVDPIPVEDRFYRFEGSIHCALVPVQ